MNILNEISDGFQFCDDNFELDYLYRIHIKVLNELKKEREELEKIDEYVFECYREHYLRLNGIRKFIERFSDTFDIDN